MEVILTPRVEQLSEKGIVSTCSFLVLQMSRQHPFSHSLPAHLLWLGKPPHPVGSNMSCPQTWCYRWLSCATEATLKQQSVPVTLEIASAFSTSCFWIPFPPSGHVCPAVFHQWELLSPWLLLHSVVTKACFVRGAFGSKKKGKPKLWRMFYSMVFEVAVLHGVPTSTFP